MLIYRRKHTFLFILRSPFKLFGCCNKTLAFSTLSTTQQKRHEQEEEEEEQQQQQQHLQQFSNRA